MKKLPRSPYYDLKYGKIDYAGKFDHWFYFWLRENWGLTKRGKFSASSNFRLVYASKATKLMMPDYLIYEHVKGAILELTADPGSLIQVSLKIRVENKNLLYYKEISADTKGRAVIRVPYSTSYIGGRITTEPFYKLALSVGGKKRFIKAVVDEAAVVEGRHFCPSSLKSSFESVSE